MFDPIEAAKGAAVGLLIGAAGAWWLTAEYKNAKHNEYVADITLKSQQAVERDNKALRAKEETARKERQLEKETYDAKLNDYEKRLAAANKRESAWGLRVTVARSACEAGRIEAGGNKPGTEDVSVEARIPDAFRKSVLDLTDEADRLRLWGEACHVEVNKPRCVCH